MEHEGSLTFIQGFNDDNAGVYEVGESSGVYSARRNWTKSTLLQSHLLVIIIIIIIIS
jgi:hypothetical protein